MLRSRSTERGGEAGGDGSAEAPGQKRPSRKEEEGRGKVGNDSGGGGIVQNLPATGGFGLVP